MPVFHCQRCLALWTRAAQVPTFCSEVNRSVYGPLIPISITKCDLLTKLLDHDRKPTMQRLCKQLPSRETVEPVLKKKVKSQFCESRVLRPPPVAELIDINETMREYRRKFWQELKLQRGDDASGKFMNTGGRTSSPVEGIDGDGEADEYGPKFMVEVFNEGKSQGEEESSLQSKTGRFWGIFSVSQPCRFVCDQVMVTGVKSTRSFPTVRV